MTLNIYYSTLKLNDSFIVFIANTVTSFYVVLYMLSVFIHS